MFEDFEKLVVKYNTVVTLTLTLFVLITLFVFLKFTQFPKLISKKKETRLKNQSLKCSGIPAFLRLSQIDSPIPCYSL